MATAQLKPGRWSKPARAPKAAAKKPIPVAAK
jgi:hypothetical protein